MYLYIFIHVHAYVYVFTCVNGNTHMFIYICISLSAWILKAAGSHRQLQWITRLILAFILYIFVTLFPDVRTVVLTVLYIPHLLCPTIPPECDQHLSHRSWHIPCLWSCSSGSCHSPPPVNDCPVYWCPLAGIGGSCRLSLDTPLHMTQALSSLLGCGGWGAILVPWGMQIL